VVPLAPIVWQTRAKVKDCSGFGDKYNKHVLGAGRCTPNLLCDPDQVTSFDASQPNRFSGRKQSLFITYEEDAFVCVDRSQTVTEWHDKSWDPWASFDNFTKGRHMKAEKIDGKDVFYKFISDVAYLQAPIPGELYLNNTNPCKACSTWRHPDCTDPIEDGPSHPMWNDSDISSTCSLRKIWTQKFLDPKTKKRSTFFTFETNELTVASLVITPQMDGIPDITTLVRVVFSVGQSGVLSAEAFLSSTSETLLVKWVPCAVATILLAITYPLNGFASPVRQKGKFIVDVSLSGAVLIYLAVNLALEFSPPDINTVLSCF